jgi:hypothetical protein
VRWGSETDSRCRTIFQGGPSHFYLALKNLPGIKLKGFVHLAAATIDPDPNHDPGLKLKLSVVHESGDLLYFSQDGLFGDPGL